MLLSDVSRASNYPFIESSSMELYRGHRLSPGVIVGANIYPLVPGGKSGYLYISGIDHSLASVGVYILSLADSVAGDISAGIRISVNSIDPDSSTIDGSVVQLDRYCGSVTVTKDILPILKLNLAFTPISFIFTPSVYHPRIISGELPNTSYPLITADGVNVLSFGFTIPNNTSNAVYLDTNGGAVSTIHSSADRFVRTVTFRSNDETETSCTVDCANTNNINMITAPGSLLRLSTLKSNSMIEVGSIDDLSTQ